MTILAAVNGEYEEDRVVSTAFDLAGAYDERLVVLHVMSNEDFADRQNATPDYFLENAEETARNVARRITRGTLGGVGDIDFRGEVGPVAETIIAVADELDVTYLVIDGRGRSAVGKALFGSKMQTLLMDADQPVVSVLQEDQ